MPFYNIHQLVFLIEAYCGLCEVRAESLYITQIHLNLSYLRSSWQKGENLVQSGLPTAVFLAEHPCPIACITCSFNEVRK